jgi:hypothetical protein
MLKNLAAIRVEIFGIPAKAGPYKKIAPRSEESSL